jgi:hypothetical protein
LIDDLHNMSPEVVAALKTWLDSQGLRQARFDVRTVLMYSTHASDGQQPTIDALAPLSNNSWTERAELDKFRPPIDRDAYQYFLLNWQQDGKALPLVVVESELNGVSALFAQFRKTVDGVPSNLPGAVSFVNFFLDLARNNALCVIEEARDDALLKASLAFQREAV